MKSFIALSLLATSAFVGSATASADSHHAALERRAAGHALPAKRFVRRTVRRAEIPDVGYLSVSANASSTSGEATFETVINNSTEAVWVNGTALWYNSTGLGGSCKVDYNSTDLLVSLPASWYPSKDVVSPLCGEQVLVKDLASGNNVSAIVSDTSSSEYLVLSDSAFRAVSPLAVGMLDVQYYFFNSSIKAGVPATSSAAVARVATTQSQAQAQAPTTTQAPQPTTQAPQPTTEAYDYASASAASKASADAAWASSSSAQAAAASKASADAAWAASSSSAAAAAAVETKSSSSSSGSSSSSQTYTGGYATYFMQNGNPGNCGTVAQESDKVIALPTVTYANGAHCGQQIVITRTDTGAQVTATVRDSCPSCVNNESLDLSQGAFTAIATESEGMVPITWHFL